MSPDLLSGFRKYSGHHGLFRPGDRIIVGISGGPDSMALADLLIRDQVPIVLAHCNFSLREQESDGDEVFVTDFARKNGIQLEVKKFQTREFAASRKISIEMAARELRYEWFEELRVRHECSWICVGHHRDDSIETTLMNLIRGTGLRGLAGIRPLNGNIVRPLLFTGRSEIRRYLLWRGIDFREDSSNRDNSFLRNRIRNELIPFFESINPGFRRNLLFEQELYGSVQGMVDRSVEEYRATSQSKTEETIRFDLTPLLNNGQSAIILFEILKPFGFNSAQIQKIHQSLEGQPGKRFISATHLLYLGRKELLIRPISETPSQNHYLDPSEPESFHDAGLLFELIEGNTLPQKSSVIACLDYDLLEFPLLLRQWKPGDSFCPLGMTGRKKISDFLIDIKASPIEKENIRVLFSGDQVIWIEKIRIDHRVRVTNITRKMLIIKSFE